MRPDHERLSNSESNDLDNAIDQALEGTHRSQKWADYVRALEHRQGRLERDLEMSGDPTERENLKQKIEEIDEQIEVLREEEKLTQFIEDSVTFSHEVRRLTDG